LTALNRMETLLFLKQDAGAGLNETTVA